MDKLPVGKVHMNILEKLLAKYTYSNNRVVVGSGIGEDAAVIDMRDHYLIAKTDPITCATDEIGFYAVNINANDIASMGGVPLWFLATILIPEGSSKGDLENIFSQISQSCQALGITYCGGHTEVTSGVGTPIVIGQMLGEARKDELRPTSAARKGDELIMTKTAAIEATAIISREKEVELSAHFSEAFISRAQNYLYDPGIGVVKDVAALAGCDGIHAFHDPTEGGIATGIYEMARASGLGVEVFGDNIPISEETKALCDYYKVNAIGTFASGSLLIAALPSASEEIIAKLKAAGIAGTRIGVLVSQRRGMKLIQDGVEKPLPVYHQDELSRIFG
ncbi:MAG: AIR synthase family protein [Deltaproteobacteria bacterium]|nr:AIR synthase family protein [Deltaproteobacteria bacterium]MBN2846250.1 AIR synthase family protein [Deltaproteobacteria bacterium]